MSTYIDITLPDIGDYRDVPIVDIHVKPGDAVSPDDPLISVESDKATMEVPSPAAGIVHDLRVAIGGKVSQGALLMVLASAEQDTAEHEKVAPPEAIETVPAAPDTVAAVAITPDGAGGSVHATPSVRALARQLGVDLTAIIPSGTKGRILREDVAAYVKTVLASPGAVGGSGIGMDLPAWPSVDFAKFGQVEREPLSRIQSISGGNLARNWLTIPHVTNFDKADVTGIEAFRQAVNGEARTPESKITMVAFLIKASALALKAFPRFNASLDGNELVLKSYVHIGFAADTPKGLMVPVIRDCDRKGVLEIFTEMRALAEKARAGTLPVTDMQGGCFSVSSLGGVGGTGFTPIINAPEVAILGAGRSATEAVWDGASLQPRLVLPLSLSWDHRVIDGVAAARFLGHIAVTLTDFRRAVL